MDPCPPPLDRVARPAWRLGGEAGMALPTALFGMVMLAVLAAGIWVSVDVSAKSTDNREDAMRAMQLAEAGAAHAVALLRGELADTTFTRLLQGSDALPLTADDGYLTGYGLASSLEIPAAGAAMADGRYFVRIVNDPADPTTQVLDTNDRVLVRSTGMTARGGAAVIDAVISEGPPPEPLVLVDGPLSVGGSVQLLGFCTTVHANGDLSLSGDPTLAGEVTTAESATVKGTPHKPDGSPVVPLEDQPEVDVEDISKPLNTHCDDADYVLQKNGWILRTSDGTLHDAQDGEKFGWKLSKGKGPPRWDYGNGAQPGTFCVDGNVKISGNPGKNDPNPLSLSVIASGSIDVSGQAYLEADSETGYLFLSGGDVRITGGVEGKKAYSGSIYARNQCAFGGNIRFASRITCKDRKGGSGTDLIDESSFGGGATNGLQCAALGNGAFSYGRFVLSWSQRFGS